MTDNRAVTISCPAKLNLGLEVLGKRQDGYHEIRTVLAMVDVFDEIVLTIDPDSDDVRLSGMDDVPLEDNLIFKAVKLFETASGIRSGYQIELTKRIPYPGGLAGASSDAAATLMALNATHGAPIPTDHLVRLGEQLGSDVPFFLGATVSLARGTGTELEILPALENWILLVVPSVNVPQKTETLYNMLTPDDYSNGEHVQAAAEAIRNGRFPAPSDLGNAFLRPLCEIAPQVAATMELMRQHGCPFVSLSGAGPGLYTHFDSEEVAQAVLSELQEHLAPDDFAEVVPFTLAANNAELVTSS